MYGVTSMYFSAVMVYFTPNQENCTDFLELCSHPTPTCCPFTSSSGTTDAGSGSSHVHSVRYWCVSGPHHLHEKLGCESARQEKQEAAGLHLPHQKRGWRLCVLLS